MGASVDGKPRTTQVRRSAADRGAAEPGRDFIKRNSLEGQVNAGAWTSQRLAATTQTAVARSMGARRLTPGVSWSCLGKRPIGTDAIQAAGGQPDTHDQQTRPARPHTNPGGEVRGAGSHRQSGIRSMVV